MTERFIHLRQFNPTSRSARFIDSVLSLAKDPVPVLFGDCSFETEAKVQFSEKISTVSEILALGLSPRQGKGWTMAWLAGGSIP